MKILFPAFVDLDDLLVGCSFDHFFDNESRLAERIDDVGESAVIFLKTDVFYISLIVYVRSLSCLSTAYRQSFVSLPFLLRAWNGIPMDGSLAILIP